MQSANSAKGETVEFLNVKQAAQLLNVSERKFHDLRTQGMVSEPVNLGPRALRWIRSELLAHVAQHARRGGESIPSHLARLTQARTGTS